MGEHKAFGVSWHRMVRLWSGVVLAGLMLSGTPLVAEAEIVVATPPGTFTGLSMGDNAGCALTPTGEAGCWAENYGLDVTPAVLPGPYREVSVGWDAFCALRGDHALDCWGEYFPKSPSRISGDFRSVSVGREIVCGIQSSRDLDRTATEEYEGHHRPTHVVGPFSWASVNSDVCAVHPVRDVLCWNSDEPRPKRIVGPFTAVSVGGEHTCALRADKDIACWDGGRKATARLRPGFPDRSPLSPPANRRLALSDSIRTWRDRAPANRRRVG